MKKVLFVMMLCIMCSINSFAQQPEQKDGTYRVYCELVGTGKLFSSKVTVNLDFGQKSSFWTGNKGILVDDNGKPLDFNSMVDAMNFMGRLDWKFVQAYVVTTSNQNVYRWLLYKDVKNDEEIHQGFKVNGDK
jgi:hypothetical protein